MLKPIPGKPLSPGNPASPLSPEKNVHRYFFPLSEYSLIIPGRPSGNPGRPDSPISPFCPI